LRPGRYQARARRMGQQGGAAQWSPTQPADLKIGEANRVRIVLP
jgi:hypothetical protein